MTTAGTRAPRLPSLAVTNPDLVAEWHPTMNGRTTPEGVTRGSSVKAWWRCARGHEWDARISSRAGKDAPGCTRCVAIDRNGSLEDVHPVLSAEWHPTKNGPLRPAQVPSGTADVVWWLVECGHEFDMPVKSRVQSSGCPICRGLRTIVGLNDLATTHPTVAAGWHPAKNGDLTPQQVVGGSAKRVWWQCEHGHEWQKMVLAQTARPGCAVCAGRVALEGFNDLATVAAEIAALWHPTKNGGLLPTGVTLSHSAKIWWQCPQGHESHLRLDNVRIRKSSCSVCAGLSQEVRYGTLSETDPEVAAAWHPTMNGDLTPDAISRGSDRRVWWLGSCGHEFDMPVSARCSGGRGCPVCYGRRVLVGFNDLATTGPGDAALWHPTKNGDLTPEKITSGSQRRAWWLGECGHEWERAVASQTELHGCPTCVRDPLVRGTAVAVVRPDVAAGWHPTKNGDLTPGHVAVNSSHVVWWLGACDHEWETSVATRTSGGMSSCPFCSGHRALAGFNDLASLAPEAAALWHPTKNGDLTAEMVTVGSQQVVWWLGECGHEWAAPAVNVARRDSRCPYCAGRRVLQGFNDLASQWPEIAAEWAHDLNPGTGPEAVTPYSGRRPWWRCPEGHVWATSVSNRAKGTGCPECRDTVSSKPEQALLAGLQALTCAEGGWTIRVGPVPWRPDIVLPDARVVVEFDGSYWHRDHLKRDKRKTRHLEANGWRVLRVREEPLVVWRPGVDVPVPQRASDEAILGVVVDRLTEWGVLEPVSAPA